jgi:hypothetical protein
MLSSSLNYTCHRDIPWTRNPHQRQPPPAKWDTGESERYCRLHHDVAALISYRRDSSYESDSDYKPGPPSTRRGRRVRTQDPDSTSASANVAAAGPWSNSIVSNPLSRVRGRFGLCPLIPYRLRGSNLFRRMATLHAMMTAIQPHIRLTPLFQTHSRGLSIRIMGHRILAFPLRATHSIQDRYRQISRPLLIRRVSSMIPTILISLSTRLTVLAKQ